MQNLQDLQEKVFFESITILETLSKITSKEELLSKQDLFSEVADRISFLKVLEKNKASLVNEGLSDFAEHQYSPHDINQSFIHEDDGNLDEFLPEDEGIEEEVIFTNEINEIEDDTFTTDENEVSSSETETEIFQEKIEDAAQEVAYEDRVAQKEREFLELEAKRRKIVEFSKEDILHPGPELLEKEEEKSQHPGEKKFKLAHIKGLKAVQNLFDEDPLEKLHEEEIEEAEKQQASGSILKTNIPTDFMEVEKKRPEFRLDLNDKVAFTKFLFKGNDAELTQTIQKLNSFDNVEDAKQYLSELYYAKDWRKADEYAQRLWSLVENKFI